MAGTERDFLDCMLLFMDKSNVVSWILIFYFVVVDFGVELIGNLVAIKREDKELTPITAIIQEVEMLRAVQGHHAIVQLIDVYETKNEVSMVMEFINGDELFDKIIELEMYTEKDAAELMSQIIEAVAYCHEKNIVHRDLKPENLMFTDDTANRLKLIDFGVSAMVLDDEDLLFDKVGTLTYMAPEILTAQGYGRPVDMYSIGVILYILLVGYPPFDPEEGIVDLEFPEDDWADITEDAINIIKNLLSNDPLERMTIIDLQRHPWITGESASEVSLKKKGTISSLRQYNTLRKMNATMTSGRSKAKRAAIFGLFDPNEQVVIAEDADLSVEYDEDFETLLGRVKKEMSDMKKIYGKLSRHLKTLSTRDPNSQNKRQISKLKDEIDIIQKNFRQIRYEFNDIHPDV